LNLPPLRSTKLVLKNCTFSAVANGKGITLAKMESSSPEPKNSTITAWLQRTSLLNFTLYASVTSFCLYTCIFSLRKTFGVATYQGLAYWGVDYKVWMVTFQVIGYMISKFIGIKVVSEMKSKYRTRGILLMVSIATVSWFLFATTPRPYNLIFLFFNGLPLGMVWSLVFGYLEGRRTTEVLGASLSVSFIFSAGFGKTVGGLVMRNWGISEFWMPFVSACFFFVPLLVFLWLIDKLPPPSKEDEALRTKRQPMTGTERMAFIKTFGPGLLLLILSYALLTAFRDFRDNFSAEIWKSLGYGDKPGIFAQTETPISIIVLISIALLMVIKKNRLALVINHLIVLLGMILVGASTLAFQQKMISAPVWMTLVGMGLYFGYIQFNSIFFDRLLAAFQYVGTVAFLINLADSFGYVGSVSVLFYKQFGQANLSWLNFFITGGYILSFAGSILMTISLFYFYRKHQTWVVPK
jgi:MFS family permease